MENEKGGAEQYLSEVAKYLDCGSAKQRAILRKIRLVLQDIPGIDSMSFSQILEITDPPEELAEFYLDMGKTQKNARTKRRVLAVIAAIGIVALILLSVFVIDTWNFNHGSFEDSPVQSGLAGPNSDALITY